MAQPQALAHHLTAQVEVAVLEPHLLAHHLIELKRQRVGAVQELDLAREHFDAARGEVLIGGAAGTFAHAPLHADHVLGAQPLGLAKHRGRIRIEDHLQQALAIAQIDENDAAVVAAAMHPAGDRDLLSDQLLVDVSAVMRAHPPMVPERTDPFSGWPLQRHRARRALRGGAARRRRTSRSSSSPHRRSSAARSPASAARR